MPITLNGHSTDYIKRQARKMCKETGITHIQALNIVVQNAGFSNWENFINSKGNALSAVKLKQIPRPSVLRFHMALGAPSSKPNARMPISAHQHIGELLKEVDYFTSDRRSIAKHVQWLKNELDDWIQKEYPSDKELPQEVFLEVYYGSMSAGYGTPLNTDQRNHLISRFELVSSTLSQHYHDCAPLRLLLRKVELAKKATARWLLLPIKAQPTRYRFPRSIQSGTLIRLKRSGEHAIVYHSPSGNGHGVNCYGHGGSYVVDRESFTVPKDQSGAKDFIPMRLILPYGKWTCADGTEVLYNRDYSPIWYKSPNGKVGTLDHDTWVSWKSSRLYYNDGQVPWHKKRQAKADECLAALKEWGVNTQRPKILDLWAKAIQDGNMAPLKAKNTSKRFPISAAA